MIGSRNLFTEILETEQPSSTGKGRSAELDALRNELIYTRYFFYLQYSDKRYEAIILALSKEFFLSQFRVVAILKKNLDGIKALRSSCPSRSALSKKYPNWNW